MFVAPHTGGGMGGDKKIHWALPPSKGYMDTMEISMRYMYLIDDPQEMLDFTQDVSRDYQETFGGWIAPCCAA